MIWVVLVIAILTTSMVVSAWFATRPQKTPKQELRDDPSYRAMVTFTRKVAYHNDSNPAWQIENSVPPELAAEARSILDKEKRELRSS